MLRKRIIFTLIYSNNCFNQSRNFRLQKVGDLKWLENNYKFKEIAKSLDELVVINASKNKEDISAFAKVLKKIVNYVFIPITGGGGIKSLEDARLLFNSGADKLILNSSLYKNPKLVKDLIKQYGSQSLVASIDYKKINGNHVVLVDNGCKKIDMSLENYLKYVEELNVGEIYLNSIDKDGTGFGYDFQTIDFVAKKLSKPLIIAGGAGNENHFIEGLQKESVDAVATANLFNFLGNGLIKAREKILNKNLNLADWSKQ